MRILALDLGTATGYATNVAGPVVSGTLDLRPRRFEGGGMKFLRFRAQLVPLLDSVEAVAFEEVTFAHRSAAAGHVYGGLLALVTAECEARSIPYGGFSVGTIKRHATGNGNAKKPAMVAAAQARLGYTGSDDDEADALWILDLARSEWETPSPGAAQ